MERRERRNRLHHTRDDNQRIDKVVKYAVLWCSVRASSKTLEMTCTAIDLCYVWHVTAASSRMVKENLSKTRSVFAAKLGSGFFAAMAIYSLVFAMLYDTYCVPLLVVMVVSICIVVGLFLVKRWGLWLGVAFIPVLELVMFSTLSSTAAFASGQRLDGLLFRTSLIVILLVAVLVFLMLLDKKKEFK